MPRTIVRAYHGAALAAALCLGCGAAMAEAPAEDTVTGVVVTGSRLAFPEVAPSADVDVSRPAGAGTTLAEALSRRSDLEVDQPGGPGGTASIYLRGGQPNFTLVMLEGVPLNDPTNTRGGSVDVSELGVFGLGRVEVARGSLSGVYGSGALSGAINLILPGGARAPAGQAVVEAGSDADYAAGLQLLGPLGPKAGGSLSVSYADAGEPVEGSTRRNGAISAKLAPLDGTERWALVARVSDSRATSFPDDSGGPRLAVLREVERREAREALAGARGRLALGDGVTLMLAASAAAREATDVTPGVAPGLRDPVGLPSGHSRNRYVRVRGQAMLKGHAGDWRWLAGAEAQGEQGRSRGELSLFGFSFPSRFDLERTTLSAFAEAAGHVGRLDVNLSMRVDRPDGFDAHLSGRAGATWDLDERVSLRAAWGRSFKAPSFYALGDSFIGNPGLKPETGETGELGLTWNGGDRGTVRFTAFHARYQDLIDFIAGPPPRLENRSAVVSDGSWVDARGPLGGRGHWGASLTYVDTRDADTGADIRGLPKWRGSVDLDWTVRPGLVAGVVAGWTGERPDSSVPTGDVTLDGFARVDASLTWTPGNDWRLRLRARNVLDADYEEAVGFASPGASVRVSLERQF